MGKKRLRKSKRVWRMARECDEKRVFLQINKVTSVMTLMSEFRRRVGGDPQWYLIRYELNPSAVCTPSVTPYATPYSLVLAYLLRRMLTLGEPGLRRGKS